MRYPSRGAGLLFEHLAAFDQMGLRPRESARVRLQRSLGPDLSRLLLRALTGEPQQTAGHAVAGDPAA